jgi:hypothetical protein
VVQGSASHSLFLYNDTVIFLISECAQFFHLLLPTDLALILSIEQKSTSSWLVSLANLSAPNLFKVSFWQLRAVIMDTFRTAAVFTADVSTEGANQKIAVLGIF